MTRHDSYDQGTPSWVDLMTTDPDAAKSFYGELFGWGYDDEPMPEGGAYHLATVGGDQVAGLGAQPPGMEGAPPVWAVYLAVDDLDAVTAKVPDAGGQVVMGPMDVMDKGRMAMVSDPAGAMVGLWQAGSHPGAQRKDEPGAMMWNELMAAEFDKAVPFYESVLGVGHQVVPMPGMDYTLLTVGENQVAGAMAPPEPGIPPHWNVYFQVDDVDAACAKAQQLGGAVQAPAFDVEGVGRMAVLSDPQGGTFSVMTPAEQPADP